MRLLEFTEDVDTVDQGEYDREGDMAIGQLNTIDDAADELRSILSADDNLPEWVQNKITKAVDYIDTARDYMKSKEEGVAEGWDKLTPQQKAHEYNLDAAQREMDRRQAQGEDMTGATIDNKTYNIVKPKQQGVTENNQRGDTLVTDASKIMQGSDVKDAVQALKTVLGDREYNSRRGFYNFYVRQLMDMSGQQGMAGLPNLGMGGLPNLGMAEANGRRYSSYNDELSSRERDEQNYMDQSKSDFKRAEMQHELGHEDDPNFERNLRQQQLERDQGPWYIRIDGKIYRQRGQPKVFDLKNGANNYALAMIKNNPSLQGKVTLSKSEADR